MHELTDAEKQAIDNMSPLEMLSQWRYAPMGTFQHNDPWSDYFIASMNEKRCINPGAWVAASKALS